jgi:wobble nucleotide-excising tRNase
MNEIEKMEQKINDMQKYLSGIRETIVGISKDLEHMNLTLSSFIIANKEKTDNLERRLEKVEHRVIWLSSIATLIGAAISLILRFIDIP